MGAVLLLLHLLLRGPGVGGIGTVGTVRPRRMPLNGYCTYDALSSFSWTLGYRWLPFRASSCFG
jgi:hypothetical protein